MDWLSLSATLSVMALGTDHNMETEWLTVCSKFMIKFCHFCIDDLYNSNYCCIEYHQLEILGILPDINQDEMCSTLHESGQQLPSNTTYGQLIELYEDENKKSECFHDGILTVIYPQLPSSFL